LSNELNFFNMQVSSMEALEANKTLAYDPYERARLGALDWA
jgi:hypothetical protein